MSLQARLDWIEERLPCNQILATLEEFHLSIKRAEEQVAEEVKRLRLLEEQLSDAEGEASYDAYFDPDLKNDGQRRAEAARAIRSCVTCREFRPKIRTQKAALDMAKTKVSEISNRQKNLRAIADLRAAQIKLLTR